MAKKARTTIRLDKANESVVFPEWPVRDEILYRLFEQTPAAEYEETYDRVLRIGSYALVEDRIGAFLAKTESEVGVELEHLKLLYELRQHSM
jgi:hypothetical protein